MNKLSYVKKAILTAACIALCVVLPMAFHAIPNAGNIYCPMHMPVLLCGLVCGWPFGLLCGVAGPLLSSLFTGMPPAAYLPSMIIELAAYGLTAGLVMRFVHTRKMMADLYISLTADRGRGVQGSDLRFRKLFHGSLDHRLFCHGSAGIADSADAASGCRVCAGEGPSHPGQVSQDSRMNHLK